MWISPESFQSWKIFNQQCPVAIVIMIPCFTRDILSFRRFQGYFWRILNFIFGRSRNSRQFGLGRRFSCRKLSWNTWKKELVIKDFCPKCSLKILIKTKQLDFSTVWFELKHFRKCMNLQKSWKLINFQELNPSSLKLDVLQG